MAKLLKNSHAVDLTNFHELIKQSFTFIKSKMRLKHFYEPAINTEVILLVQSGRCEPVECSQMMITLLKDPGYKSYSTNKCTFMRCPCEKKKVINYCLVPHSSVFNTGPAGSQ